jgi:hypothetical protein
MHASYLQNKNIYAPQSYLELSENEYTIYQNLWNTAKTVVREKFIVMSEYI